MMDLTDKREANPEDIVVGNKVYYPDINFSCVIKDVLRPDDMFKAFSADDGCRYGLDGAYVKIIEEKEPVIEKPVIIPIWGGVMAITNKEELNKYMKEYSKDSYMDVTGWTKIIGERFVRPIIINDDSNSEYLEEHINQSQAVFKSLELPYKIICSMTPNTPCFVVGTNSELVMFVGPIIEM